jgi:thioredoxin reductase (NADPH)
MMHNLYDLVIIGAGPAGLTCAIYAARARLKVLVLESFSLPTQAVTTSWIENYPGFPEGIGGFELVEKMKQQAAGFGAEFATQQAEKIAPAKFADFPGWQIEAGEESHRSLSLVIASGARPKKLGVPGEERFTGKGVSYCGICDAALYKGKEVVVVGGGDTAIEDAIFLTKFAAKVTVIHRRDRLRATRVLQERAQANKKIAFIWNCLVEEILGKEKVEAVRLNNLKENKKREISCSGVFIFAGLIPNTDFVKGLVNFDSQGYIVVDKKMCTNQQGVFACGDCRDTSLRQVITACADGAFAAHSAQEYIDELKGIAYK